MGSRVQSERRRKKVSTKIDCFSAVRTTRRTRVGFSEEQSHVFLDHVNFGKAPLEKQSCNKNNYLATEFMHDFASKSNL